MIVPFTFPRLLGFIGLFSIFIIGYGQTAGVEDKFHIEEFVLPGGKLSNNVNYITQGPRGFMWFASHSGLHRFDGYQFVSYTNVPGDSTSLTFPHIEWLHWDSKGKLWIGSYGGGLFQFDPDTESFRNYKHDPNDPETLSHNRANCVVEDTEGYIWIGTDEGLNKLDPLTGKVERFMEEPGVAGKLQHGHIRRLYVDHEGTLWVGAGLAFWAPEMGGLHRYDPQTNSLVAYLYDPGDPNSIWTSAVGEIYEDSQDRLWIGTTKGLQLFDRENEKFKRMQDVGGKMPYAPETGRISKPAVYSIQEDRDGGLWVGTIGDYKDEDRLLRFDPTSNTIDIFPIDVPIWDLFESRDGSIWIASAGIGGKVYQIRPKSRIYPLQQGVDFADQYFLDQRSNGRLPAKNERLEGPIELAMNSRSGNLWAMYTLIKPGAGDSKVLGRLEAGSDQMSFFELANVKLEYPEGNTFGVKGMEIDQKGMVWGFNEGGDAGIFRFDPSSNEKQDFLHQPGNPNSLPSNVITHFIIDSRGEVWIATFEKGLSRYNPRTQSFTHYSTKGEKGFQIGGDFPMALMEDRLGNIWVGGEKTSEGTAPFVTVIDPINHITKDYQFSDEITYWPIKFFVQDSIGNIWMKQGTNGLAKLDPETGLIRPYNTVTGNFPIDAIASMFCGPEGKIWVSDFQEMGFVRLDPETDEVYQFRSMSDMASIQRAGTIGLDGHILFPNKKGWTEIDPSQIIPPNYPNSLPLQLTDFIVADERFPPAENELLSFHIWELGQLIIPNDIKSFGFHFSNFDFAHAEKVKYEFRLFPYENRWRKPDGKPVAKYFRVRPGDNTFQVRIAGSEEKNSIISLPVVVDPPWWQTNLAYVGYAVLLGLILFLARKEIIRRERLRSDYKMKEMEAQRFREMDQVKSRFFANISHEFRTPLTLIIGPIQRMLEGKFQGDIQEQYKLVLRNGQRLMELINQLLDLSKLDAGKMKLEAAREDLIPFLQFMVAAFESQAASRNMNLIFKADEEACYLYFDRDKMEKIMLNLLSNAFKFTSDGGTIELQVVGKGEEKGKEGVNIVLSDSGIGIDKEKIPHVFDRFYQVDDTDTRMQEGTGIGLAMVQELVALHQGRIEVSSNKGAGSIFKLFFLQGKEHLEPNEIISRGGYSPHDMPNVEPKPKEPNILAKKEQQSTILVVEDNRDMRSYLSNSLQVDYHVLTAANGKKGMELARSENPELIISDLMMPLMDGKELCKQIKSDKDTSHIPVILLTAHADESTKVESLGLGADDYLTKPFSSLELSARVKNLIEQRRQLREKFNQNIYLKPAEITINSADQEFLEKAIDVIEKHMEQSDFGVETFVETLGLKHQQVYRKLKALTDQSPSVFIRTIKLKRASQLLQQPHMTVAEAMYAAGFSNPAYFSQIFKKQFGKTPTEYAGR